MKDKNSSVIKFDNCNTIYEIVELMKEQGEGVPYYIDARTTNIVKNGYEEAIAVLHSKLEIIGRPDFISEEQYDEVNSRFYNIMFNAVNRVNKCEAYADDVAFIMAFFEYTAKLLELHGIKFDSDSIE